MIVRRSESTVIPTEIDDTSSRVTVYINKNIVPVNRENDDGTTTTFYQFDQEVYTKEEYNRKVAAQTRADIDYLAIMTGVEL